MVTMCVGGGQGALGRIGTLPVLASGFVTLPGDARFTRAVRVEPGAPTPGTTRVTVVVRSATGTGARETALATILAE